MYNLEEIDEFLEKYNLPKLNREEIESLDRSMTSMEIKVVINNFPTKNKKHFRTKWLHSCILPKNSEKC